MTTFQPNDTQLKIGIIEEIQHMSFFIKENFSAHCFSKKMAIIFSMPKYGSFQQKIIIKF